MKTLLAIVAWFGLFLIAIATLPAFSSSYTWATTGELGSGVGYSLTGLVGYLGVTLALIGGFTSRPKYFWSGAIIIGCIYLISLYGYLSPSAGTFLTRNGDYRIWVSFIFAALPAIICIIGGIILRKSKKPRELLVPA